MKLLKQSALVLGTAALVWLVFLSCTSPQDQDPETEFKMMSPKPLSENTDSIEVWVEYGDKITLLYSGTSDDAGFNGPYIKTVDDYNGEDINLIVIEYNAAGEVISEQETQYNIEGGSIVNSTVLTLWPDSVVLYTGDDTTLNAAVFPSADSSAMVWSSNDSTVVTVTNTGVVQAVGTGTASVIAALEIDGSVADTAWIEVTTQGTSPVESIQLTLDTLKLVLEGNEGILTYSIYPCTVM
jgi:uncharacterized protein YjdB